MSKNKNSLSVLCYNKKNTHTTVPFGFRWAPFLIFQLFIALLVVQPTAWAGLSSLTVDANGDSVFNGEDEKLSITFTTDGLGDENRTYTYKIFVNGRTTPIFSGPREGDTLSGKQTVQVEWDGRLEGETNRLPDGDYTIKVVLNIVNNGEAAVQDEKLEQTAKVTLDTTAPEISISIDNMEFSPTSEKKGFPVYYGGLDEDVAEAWLEFQRDTGGDPIKRAIEPNELSKEGGIYYWDGKDNNSRPFFDGQYTLQLWVKDRGGNVAGSNKTETITIDSADNAAPTLESVATDKGKFITPGSGISGEMSFVEATLEDNIELNLDDSTIRLIGPSGSPVLGQQTRPADNKIRWQMLSPLLAKDGLQDGQYTVEIVGADKAGNKTTPILITFLFDNLAPELVSLKPTRDGEAFNILGDTVYYNLPLNQFVATFNDGESGTGVAFSGGQEPTSIVFGTPNPDSSITRISGRAFPDQNNDVLTYILNAPLLKTDGSQDGDYSLNVRATDSLGNTKTYTYRIIYDTQVPTLGTTVPAANQTVSNLSEVVVKLNEVTSGIDFVQSTFRLNRGVGENQVEVPVNISSNGADTATLSLLQPIALDGSDDGTYTLEVTPTDLAGNIGAVVRRQFYLVSRTQPQVRLTTPATGTVNSLDSITVEINNYIGSGINFDASTITVRNARGLLVPQAEVESDATSNQLTWSTEATIPRNGTADGRYTITATFVDFSGKRFTQSFPIVLDTQFPSVNSVEVITDPQVQLSLNSATDIPETFSQITIAFDQNDIDFENTTVSLTGPGETDIALHRSHDGDTLLTLNFQNLAQLGTYTFTLTPIDRIGNVSETPFIYRFRLDIAVPVVTTVLIGGQSGPVVYVNGSASEIVVTLVDTTGAGIAIGDGESIIVVTTDSGLPVPGITTTNDENQLIWQPTALPTDGSADGRYTVAITPIDKVGRTGDVAYRSFILDTQAPRISAATPITLHQPISYIGESLTQFQFTAEDVGPALLDLDDQTIVLNKTSGEAVAGQITHDGNNQLFFTLFAPLPTDGSADGEYVLTVDLLDKAGNPYQLKHNLFYDSQVPRLSAVSLNTETPLSLTPYQVTDLSESISKLTLNFVESTRVDFTETMIVLAGPDGSAIPLTLENNGIDQIVVSFVSLTQGGLYTLSVTPQDIAGNVAQGAVPYPFRLEFEVPGLASVKANSVAASVGLVQHEIIDISESISSLTFAFTDAMRVDFKNTRVVLVGPSGQEIPVTLEDNDGSQLMVRFVSLTQSGLYTLSVTPQDIAGNVAQSAMRYQFRLDIALPTVSSVLIDGKLGTNVYANNANINVVVTLFDPTGVGLALGNEGSTIVVTNAEGLVVSGIITSNGTNELTWTPSALPVDGSADGRYTVTITPVDKSGRSGTIVNRHFILDTQAPHITASTPVTLYQPVSYIGDSLSYFQFTVEDAGPSLLDLDDQTIGFKKKSGEVVSGQITNDGSNQLFFTLSAPLPTDGSADGEYVLTVDLVDKAGNPYQIEHNISYDSQAPQLSVVSLNTETPLNLTPYEVTDLSESISKLTLKFVEVTRVDFAESVITLMSPDGSAVPLTLENNGIDEITVSFVTLTQGGIYTLSVTPQDIAGNVAQGAVPYPFRLEFKVPGLASVKANSVAASIGLVQHEIIDISESISSLTFAFTDAIRVDFKNTGVVLVGPSGQEIPVTLEDNDGSQLMVRFVSLTQSGLYTLSVTPQDIAGNVAQSAMRYQFRLDIALPTVSSVLIDGELGTNVYANNANINVVVTLFDPTGVGLALGDEGSTIVVTNAEGLVVSGIITPNGTNKLTWTPSALPVDGSADGRYTVTITPIDKSGRSGTIVNRHFILDTQAPRITASTPVTLYQPVSYIGDSLSYFQFTVEDAGPSLLDLDDQTIGFKKKSGEVVSGQITNDGSNQLFFTLSAPLPTDGSADGEYVLTVDLVDKAGNPYQLKHNLFYDSQVPRLSAVSLNTETPLSLTPYQVTDLSESISKLTLNFVESTRVDFTETAIVLAGPDGSAIPLTLENNGIDQIVASFVSLMQGGLYTLSVTPQDIAGNVAQGAVPYPFRLEFKVPGLASVKANSVAASIGLVQHEIIDISESISSLTFAFTDAMRVDFKNTRVVLVGPSGQEIPVTLEDNDGSQLMVRFVSLTQSGLYTLSVTPQDIAGNVAQSAMRYQFRLDIALPTVSSVLIDGELGTNVYANNANINVVVTLFDPTGVGLALGDEGSTIVVTNAEGLVVSGIITSNGTNELTWTPTVLPTDGSADGRYTVTITPIDKSGRSGTIVNRHFILDTQAPRITASTPVTLYQPVSYIGDSLSYFQFTVEDAGPSLLDLDDQTIGFKKKSGEVVSGQITNDGSNQLFFTLSAPLPTDGSADGEYVLTVDLVDKAGNPYQLKHNLFYDSQVPRLSAVSLNTETPLSLTPYQVTDLSESISKLTLNFVESTRVDFTETAIVLAGPDGSAIPLTLENNGIDQIVASFVSLMQGGLYTLSVTPQDIAGNVAQGAVPYPFRLEFEVPGLASVKANSVAASVGLVQHEIIDISESISSLTFAFTDAMRVDFKNTRVVLVGPSGQEIPVTLEDNDGSQLMVRFVSLTQSGLYTLSVTPQDIAGNVAQSAMRYQFRLDIALPTVSSVLIDGELGTNVYANNANINVVVTLFDPTGVGLALGDEGSTIVVTNAEGLVVSGIITSNGTNELTWTPTVLPTDGSADGRYTVTITPIDKSGRSGTIVNRHFILDTQAPRITASTPVTLYQPVSYIGDSLSYFQFTVEDAGPSLLDLDDQTIGFKKKSGEVVSGQITNDGSNQLFFTLSAPLPTDGSADGEYVLTVDLVDKAGNPYQIEHNISYDSQAPQLSVVSLNTETPLNLTPYEVTDLSESINKLTLNFVESTRVDFAESVITLMSPDGSAVPLTLENNGIDEITVSFVTLTQGGIYTLSVTPQDIAGNVAQGAVPYPFRLKFEVPGLASVKANTADASLGLTSYEITDITESISSLTLAFTDAARVDLENTRVTLTGEDGQEIPVTLEDDGASQLVVRFVSLTQSGLYTLSVTPQDIAGNVAQGAVPYPFRLKFEVPGLASVKANTADASLGLTSYEITDITESISSLTLAFTDAARVDLENTRVTLTGEDGQEIPVTLEDDGNSQLVVRFVSLTQSGLYTLSVTPQDIAGNVAQGAVPYPFRLKFEVPGLASVKANTADASLGLTSYEITDITESISSLTLAFTDAARVDLENTRVTLTGEDGQEIPVTLEDDGASQLVVRFVSLTQSGLYTLSVTPQDIAGNVAQGAVPYPFRLKFEVPGLASVKANTADASLGLTSYEITDITESISSLTLAFTDAARVDLENTRVTLTGEDGQEIPVTLEDDGNSQLVVRFVSLTQSGLYTLSVTPQDIAGNVAQGAVPYPFRLKFEVPGLASVKANTADASLELTSYEITDITESISSLTLAFTDAARVDLENTRVTLTGEDGQEIPVTLEDDGNSQLVVRFVSLTQSGMYTLSVTPQDIAGNVAQGAVPYPFRLKFAVSGLASVKANTADASLELIQHEITEISEILSSLTLAFTDGMAVDFENTIVTLTGPDAQEIPVSLEENDDSQLVVRFVSLMQSGLYTLTVTPQDKAGNVAQSAIRYQFRLDIALPTVGSVLIDGKPGSAVYVSRSIPKIVATIIDSIGVGVSFGDKGTAIVVTNDQGIQVPGTTTSNGTNQLTWTPTPLPTDGSVDGQYTVAITPVDKAGRSGTVVNRQFIYDTQAPRITEATPVTLHAPVSYLGGGLNQFVLTIEDVGPADLLLVSQVVALMDAAGKPVPAALTHDALTNQLYLTLSKPFASDGSVDGAYTLNVLLIDKAGNSLISRFAVVYDSQVPQVSSVEVNTAGAPMELVTNQVSELSESIDTITIKFNEVTRIDFANTSVSLIDPDDQTIPITQGDDGVSQLTLSFAGLTQIGQYTLSVTPQDIAGNAAQSPIQFQFNIQFILPDVESIIIGDTVTLGSADTAYVNADNLLIVANLLDPAGTGLSFDTLTGSDILVATLDGIIIPGTTSTNRTNLIAWRPLTLSDDGSSDGRYAVYVTPVDKKGREGNTIYREFVYDTQKPEITAADPIDLSQPVSYISESLTQLQFTLQDVGPADITLADQKVALRNQNGVVIPTKLTNDSNNQIYLTLNEPLPLDGSRDGEYTVDISFTDKAGNVLDVEHPIVYDTQAPTLVSTVPDHGDQLTEDVTQIQVNLDDKGDSGIDWTLTMVTLVNPDGVEISGELTSNGKSQLTLNTNQLVADGKYIIRVQAIDRAGNGSESVFERSFLLSRRLPAIISTLPSTAPQDEAFTNAKVEQIEVMLETADERHLSTLRLLNAASQVVAGQQHRESGKLIYRLVRPLATDGSEDGLYTIEFTPISSSGRSGEIQELVFAYDTQSPELEPETIQLIVAEPEVNNSLTEIRLPLTDNQAGIDWENLDEEWLTFERLSPNATKIAGRVSFDEQDNLIFRLTVPLADNGSADGEYRISVTPTDKAGNGDETYEKIFIYDTSPPMIDPNSLLINDAPLLTDIDAEDYPSAISTSGGVVIQASVTDTGLGVDLSQSRIVVRNPNGAEISGSTQQNGVDTLVFKSDGLTIEGVHQVLITSIGNDSELLGFAPKGSITTEFLYETTAPTAVVTSDGGKTELTDEPLPLEGTAADPQGTRRAGPQGEGEIPVPASGIWLVEIVGTGPDGQPIEPVPTEDESDAQEEPWSRWSVDFLPTRSGEYDIDIRVTDKAGNYAVYDYGKVTMSVSFSFRGNTFGWPNPLRHSKEDVAFFSFDLNASADEKADLTLYIYDWGGDMVYSQKHTDITPGERNDTQIKWNLENQAGTPVARGLYVFRLEAVNGAGNRANAVGKILVVD